MAKTKTDKSAKAGHSSKSAEVKAITSVKEGAVTKPSQTPKAKSQEIAKQVALKANTTSKPDKKAKKVVKEPTPEASSDESDDDEEASSDSSESSDSDEEPAPAAAKTNGKVNGKVNGKSNGVSDGAAHSDSSESSDSSDDDDAPVSAKAPAAATAESEGSDSDDDDDSDASDSDEATAKKGPIDAKKLTGALTKVASEEGSEADSDDSDDSDEADSDDGSSSSSEDEDEAPPKKRKAETEAVAPVKKAKKDETSKNGGDGVRNLFVGSLSWSVDEEWLTREFEGFGELSGVRIITDKATGRSKGFGYVEFANAADAAKAHDAMKGKMIDNREINIDFSVPRSNDSSAGAYQNRSNDRAKTYGDQVSEPSETLFVGNISFEATEDIVGEEFGKFGSVQSVRLPTDQETGNPKGFGYVQFASIDEAKAAFEGMKGAAICGRPIRLDYGKPRAANGDSPGGRGGRGGFSRGGRGGDRGGRGGGRGRGGFGDRGGRGGSRGGRGGSTNRGGFGDFQGKKMTF